MASPSHDRAPSPSPNLPSASLLQATPATADTSSHTGGDRGKSLSPNAPSFFPSSAGRSKAMRWDEVCVSDCSDDELEEPKPEPRYLHAARRATSPMPSEAQGLEVAKTSTGGGAPVLGVPADFDLANHAGFDPSRPKRRRQQLRRRRRGPGPDAGARNLQAPPTAPERIPVHQRLGPHYRATAPDKDGWQRVLPQRPEQEARQTRPAPRQGGGAAAARGTAAHPPQGGRGPLSQLPVNGPPRRDLPAAAALLQLPRSQPLRAGLQAAMSVRGL